MIYRSNQNSLLRVIFYTVSLSCFLLLSSCHEELFQDFNSVVSDRFVQKEIYDQSVVINPSGFSPLTALIQFKTNIPVRVSVKVLGKRGVLSDVVKDIDSLSLYHKIPVLGLYGDYSNTVLLTLLNAKGKNIGTSGIRIQTASLSKELPSIKINVSKRDKKPGMTLVSYLANNQLGHPNTPFIFDEFGDIRWYLDYSTSSILNKLSFDNGIERLKNGNFYFGDINSGGIYEINMFGEILNTWTFPGYKFHHNVLEKPNGNFLVTVSKQGISTTQDHIIEIDRNTNQIVNFWDIRQSLQYSRTTLNTNTVDWIHINAIEYDASDNSIIVSGRTQGVVKLDINNHVKWIIGPHRGWGLAGDGTDLNTKLLKPLDANNQPITDTSIINGYSNHQDFEWNWYQHAVKIAPGGNISMFDNGFNRNYGATSNYSRAVEYKIDPVNMTIKQVWEYGKERGVETYSFIVSDVDYHNDVNHVIISPGAVNNIIHYGKIIEVDYTSATIYFEATLYPPASYSGFSTFHRTQRLSLYL